MVDGPNDIVILAPISVIIVIISTVVYFISDKSIICSTIYRCSVKPKQASTHVLRFRIHARQASGIVNQKRSKSYLHAVPLDQRSSKARKVPNNMEPERRIRLIS